MDALRPSVLIALLLLVAGCQAREAQTSEAPRFSTTLTILIGYRFYSSHDGHLLFALGLDGPLCLRDGRDLSEVVEGRFAELRGYLSARGRFGNMTNCLYVFKVVEVIEDRELTASDREVLGQLFRVVAEPPPGETPGAQFQQSRERN